MLLLYQGLLYTYRSNFPHPTVLDIGTSRDAETRYLRKTAAFSGQVGDEGDSLKILLHGAPHRP